MLNIYTVYGHLACNPDIITKTRDNGDILTIARFAIGVNKPQPKDSKKKADPLFIHCVAFGYLAEKAGNLLKGAPCIVSGSLEANNYESEGKTIKTFKLVVQDLYAVKKPEKENEQEQQGENND